MSDLAVPINKSDHINGPAKAPVTLVEYGDYECPYCGQAHLVINELEQDLKQSMRFVFRNFPLAEIHPHALSAAMAAEAAGIQGSFWDMHDVLFEHQDALENQDLISYAYGLELDVNIFLRDMESKEISDKVKNDVWSGIQSGVNGTPSFFINGQRHEGSYAYGDLHRAIEQTLTSSRAKAPR